MVSAAGVEGADAEPHAVTTLRAIPSARVESGRRCVIVATFSDETSVRAETFDAIDMHPSLLGLPM
jgi:hypothetical protein